MQTVVPAFVPPHQIYAPKIMEAISPIVEPIDGRGGLYLGNLMATMRLGLLLEYNIGAILSVSIDAKFDKSNQPRMAHIAGKHILAHDAADYDISQHFEECYQWIQMYLNQGVNVLVHCRAGISRSATIVIAYLMKKYHMGLDQAYTYVKSRRSLIAPNEGFRNLLKWYEIQLKQQTGSQILSPLVAKNINREITATRTANQAENPQGVVETTDSTRVIPHHQEIDILSSFNSMPFLDLQQQPVMVPGQPSGLSLTDRTGISLNKSLVLPSMYPQYRPTPQMPVNTVLEPTNRTSQMNPLLQSPYYQAIYPQPVANSHPMYRQSLPQNLAPYSRQMANNNIYGMTPMRGYRNIIG